MDYAWKSTITFDPHGPLEVGTIMVDLCTGEKHRVTSIETHPKPVLMTVDAGECTNEEIIQLRREADYTLNENCKPLMNLVWTKKTPDSLRAIGQGTGTNR